MIFIGLFGTFTLKIIEFIYDFLNPFPHYSFFWNDFLINGFLKKNDMKFHLIQGKTNKVMTKKMNRKFVFCFTPPPFANLDLIIRKRIAHLEKKVILVILI